MVHVRFPFRFVFRVLVLVLGLVAANRGEAAGRQVTFRAPDGRAVAGLLMEASQRPAPAVVLVPMLGTSRDEWQTLGQRLADANITALAIDLPASAVPAEPAALVAWQGDVRAALDYLSSRPDVRAGALGVAGASLGANLAVLAAADRRVRSLALVSPSLDYRGVRIEAALRQYGSRPALLIASLKDPYAARSVRELAKDPPGIRETRWADTAAHGSQLLQREPDLVRAVVEWFQRTL
jgi:dienelactone hydrolase